MDQETKLTVPEFAARIKQKYPTYANVDDGELTQRIIKQYPQYEDQVDIESFGIRPSQYALHPEIGPVDQPTQPAGPGKDKRVTGTFGLGAELAAKGLAGNILNASGELLTQPRRTDLYNLTDNVYNNDYKINPNEDFSQTIDSLKTAKEKHKLDNGELVNQFNKLILPRISFSSGGGILGAGTSTVQETQQEILNRFNKWDKKDLWNQYIQDQKNLDDQIGQAEFLKNEVARRTDPANNQAKAPLFAAGGLAPAMQLHPQPYDLSKLPNDLLDEASKLTVPEKIAQTGREMSIDAQNKAENYKGIGFTLGQQAVNLAPIAATIAAGVIPGVGPGIAMGLNAVVSGGYGLNQMGELLKKQDLYAAKNNVKQDPDERMANAIIGGAAEFTIMNLGLKPWVPEGFVGGQVTKYLMADKGIAPELITKYLGQSPKTLQQFVNTSLSGAASGGELMGMLETANQFADNIYKDPKDQARFVDMVKSVGLSTAYGTAFGLFMGPLHQISKNVNQERAWKRDGGVWIAQTADGEVVNLTGREGENNVGRTRDGQVREVTDDQINSKIFVPIDKWNDISKAYPKAKEQALEMEQNIYIGDAQAKVGEIMSKIKRNDGTVMEAVLPDGRKVFVKGVTDDGYLDVIDQSGQSWKANPNDILTDRKIPVDDYRQELLDRYLADIGMSRPKPGETQPIQPALESGQVSDSGPRNTWTDPDGVERDIKVEKTDPDNGMIYVSYQTDKGPQFEWVSPGDIKQTQPTSETSGLPVPLTTPGESATNSVAPEPIPDKPIEPQSDIPTPAPSKEPVRHSVKIDNRKHDFIEQPDGTIHLDRSFTDEAKAKAYAKTLGAKISGKLFDVVPFTDMTAKIPVNDYRIIMRDKPEIKPVEPLAKEVKPSGPTPEEIKARVDALEAQKQAKLAQPVQDIPDNQISGFRKAMPRNAGIGNRFNITIGRQDFPAIVTRTDAAGKPVDIFAINGDQAFPYMQDNKVFGRVIEGIPVSQVMADLQKNIQTHYDNQIRQIDDTYTPQAGSDSGVGGLVSPGQPAASDLSGGGQPVDNTVTPELKQGGPTNGTEKTTGQAGESGQIQGQSNADELGKDTQKGLQEVTSPIAAKTATEPETAVNPAAPVTASDEGAKSETGFVPSGTGPFGGIFTQFKGKAKEAVDFLLQRKEGEAVAALHHPDIGDIDLVWGEEGTGRSDGYGLAKISKYHPEVITDLQKIISGMKITSQTNNRIQLESIDHKAAVRLDWQGDKKTWLLTAFEKESDTIPASSTDNETGPVGGQIDTATLPNGITSANKDNVQSSGNQPTAQNNSETFAGTKFSGEDAPSQNDESRRQAKSGTDPNEIAAAYQAEILKAPYENLNPWQKELIGRKVSARSFARFGDPNQIGKNIAINWIDRSNEHGNDIDGIAQELTDNTGMEVSPEDIVQFIKDNPTNQVRKTTDLQRALAKRYREITGNRIEDHKFGIPLTPEEASASVKLEHWQIEAIDENGITSLDILDSLKDQLFNGFPYEQTDYENIKRALESRTNAATTQSDGSHPQSGNEVAGEGKSHQEVKKPEPAFLTEDYVGQRLTPEPEPAIPSERDIAIRKIEDEIASKKQQLADTRKAREKKFTELDGRNGLFGDTEFAGNRLFQAEFSPTQENVKKALADYDGQIRTLEDDIARLQNGKERNAGEAAGQTRMGAVDNARIQELKNSIAEGQMILKSGKSVTGRKMSAGELTTVQRTINNATAKIDKLNRESSNQVTEQNQLNEPQAGYGKQLPNENSLGKPIASTPEGVKNFWNWFGDGEKAGRIEKLRQKKAIEISGTEITPSEDLREYKRNALQYGQRLRGDYVNEDTGVRIHLSSGSNRGGIREILQHDYRDIEHLQSIAAIPDIISNSIFIDELVNEKPGKNPDVVLYKYFVVGLKIGDIDYTVKAVVTKSVNGESYYDHKLTKIEKGKLLEALPIIQKTGAYNNSSPLSGIKGNLLSGENQNKEGKSSDFIRLTKALPVEKSPFSNIKDKRLLDILQIKPSKVVDGQGRPLVVYHGTDADFDIFKYSGDIGFHFGTIDQANAIAENKSEGGSVMPVYLNIANPLVTRDFIRWDPYPMSKILARDGILTEQEQAEIGKLPFNEGTKRLVEVLRSMGYDGIQYENSFEGEGESWITFASSQIKSATGNDGQFSSETSDITKEPTETFAGSRFAQEQNKPELSGTYGTQEKIGQTYTTQEGEAVPYQSLYDLYDRAGSGDVRGTNSTPRDEPYRRSLKPGEFAQVERKYTHDKNFRFSGNNRIESSDDVAYLFRQLEKASVENVFAVYVDKEGKAVVQHLSMGGFSSSIMDINTLIDGAKRFEANTLYFVHNHPSGNLTASPADEQILKKVKAAFPQLDVHGVIINVNSGKYSVFRENGVNDQMIRPSSVRAGEKQFPILKFDRQVFRASVMPIGKVKSSQDVAQFISTNRLGHGGKTSLLVLDRANQIMAKLELGETDFSGPMADEISSLVIRFGGSSAILFGRFNQGISQQKITDLGANLKDRQVTLMDVIDVGTDPIIDVRGYRSFADEGVNMSEGQERYTPNTQQSGEVKEPFAGDRFRTPDPIATSGPMDKLKYVPGVTEGAEFFTKLRESFRDTFLPYDVGEGGKRASQVMRGNLGAQARRQDMAAARLKEASKQFSKMSNKDVLDFINRMELGEIQPTPELTKFAGILREALDTARERIRSLGLGKLDSYIENYFPHNWTDPKKAARIMFSESKRPLEGTKSFLKKRTILTTKEGVDLGLIPISWNPVDLTLTKLREMERYYMAHKTLSELKDQGYVKFVRVGSAPPDGYRKIDDKISTVQIKTDDGLQVVGHYYADENAAKIFNNFLSKGLRGMIGYDMFRGIGNVLTQFQLGLSAFHVGFTSFDAAISRAALGFEYLFNGHIVKAAEHFATFPLAPVTNIIQGDKLLKAWFGNPSTPEMELIAQYMEMAGGRAKMDDFYATKFGDRFRDNLRNKRILSAGVNAILWPVEKASIPIMEWIVPRQKLGVFMDMVRYEMRVHPNATMEERRSALQYAWNSVDNRMGQLVYDNLFWNKVTKDIAMGSVRSVGWNLGTIREVGGAPEEILHTLTEGVKGKRSDRTHKIAYLMALFGVHMMASAIYQYLRTGEKPTELKDYFFPKTGALDKNGDPIRSVVPTYVKDLYHYARKPFKTLKNKLSPVFSILAQTISNKDFYGVKLYNEDDPFFKKGLDYLKYLGTNFIPFGIRNAQKTSWENPEDKVLPFVGITPAPYDLNMSKAEEKAYDIMASKIPVGARTKEQKETSDLKKKLREDLVNKGGDQSSLDEAVDSGKLTKKEAQDIVDTYELTPIERTVKHFSYIEVYSVFKDGTDQEKQLLAPIIQEKIANKRKNKDLTEAEQDEMDRIYDEMEFFIPFTRKP